MKKKNIIAVVFDFDDTLGPDSTSGFLNSLGVDVPGFWKEVDKMYLDHWDPVPAYLQKMILLNQKLPEDKQITKSSLQKWGEKTPLYKGVEQVFEHLQELMSDVSIPIELEFYVISSGIEEVIRASRISKHFKDIWACDFEYDSDERIVFPKRIVSFTDKTRYLFDISKGLIGSDARTKPFDVNLKFAADEKRIPMDQMIFVGDGYTDVPCFSLIGKVGGIPLAVCDPEDRQKWGKAWGFMESKRVLHWAMANYELGSTLHGSLCMAIEKIIKRIEMR
ncbi:MAG: haloacid dehalogenase-like hydrolase [Waddliaceae bacterium]|jgi:hypothetical protein|nr:haloacid dehalogenase-like hydrolase [Candidatus Jacksonbacteria bacterium]MBT6928794.1 haloacid dehalogenase-like hydrolase [Waddliaceae bacterium]